MKLLKQSRLIYNLLNNNLTASELEEYVLENPDAWLSAMSNANSMSIIASKPSYVDLINNSPSALDGLLNSPNLFLLFRNKNVLSTLLNNETFIINLFNNQNALDIIGKDKVALQMLSTTSKFLELISFDNDLLNTILNSSLGETILSSPEFIDNLTSNLAILGLNQTFLNKVVENSFNNIKTDKNKLNLVGDFLLITSIYEHYQNYLDTVDADPVAVENFDIYKVPFNKDKSNNIDYFNYFISKPNLKNKVEASPDYIKHFFNNGTFSTLIDNNSGNFLNDVSFLVKVGENTSFHEYCYLNPLYKSLLYQNINVAISIRKSFGAMVYFRSISETIQMSYRSGNEFSRAGGHPYFYQEGVFFITEFLDYYMGSAGSTPQAAVCNYLHLGFNNSHTVTFGDQPRTRDNALILNNTDGGSPPGLRLQNSVNPIDTIWYVGDTNIINMRFNAVEGHFFSRLSIDRWINSTSTGTPSIRFNVIKF